MVLWKTKGQYHFSDCFQRCLSGKATGRKVLAEAAARTSPGPSAWARWRSTEWGAGWPGMGTPWYRWAGWEQWWFPNQMQIAPCWGTRSSPMQCACSSPPWDFSDFLLSQGTAFPWGLSPASLSSYSHWVLPHWGQAVSGNEVWQQ